MSSDKKFNVMKVLDFLINVFVSLLRRNNANQFYNLAIELF